MDRGARWATVHVVTKSRTCDRVTNTFTAAAKSPHSCPTLCDPIDGSPPGSPVPGILQARTLEWVAISFSNAWKWKVKVKMFSHVWLLATPWTTAYQAPPPMGFSRQEYWSGVPLPSLFHFHYQLLLGKKSRTAESSLKVQSSQRVVTVGKIQRQETVFQTLREGILWESCPPARALPTVCQSCVPSEQDSCNSWVHLPILFRNPSEQSRKLCTCPPQNRYTLLYLKWITNKDTLPSTGDSAKCYVAAWMGGEFLGEWYLHIYGWVPLLSIWNYHNIVNWL